MNIIHSLFLHETENDSGPYHQFLGSSKVQEKHENIIGPPASTQLYIAAHLHKGVYHVSQNDRVSGDAPPIACDVVEYRTY